MKIYGGKRASINYLIGSLPGWEQLKEVENLFQHLLSIVYTTVCDKRRLQTCRPQTCRLTDLQTCRLADLQTCGLADTFGTHGEWGRGDNCPRRFNPEVAL